MTTKPRKTRALRLSEEGEAAIQTLADAEQRTWSDMARILLGEALQARVGREPRRRI